MARFGDSILCGVSLLLCQQANKPGVSSRWSVIKTRGAESYACRIAGNKGREQRAYEKRRKAKEDRRSENGGTPGGIKRTGRHHQGEPQQAQQHPRASVRAFELRARVRPRRALIGQLKASNSQKFVDQWGDDVVDDCGKEGKKRSETQRVTDHCKSDLHPTC